MEQDNADLEQSHRRGQRGASAVEYGLLVVAIAAIIILIVFALGKFTQGMFRDTCNALSSGGVSGVTATCS